MPRSVRHWVWIPVLSLVSCCVVACGGTGERQAVAAPGTTATTADHPAVQASPRLFASDSVWNAPLSASAPLDPASPQLVHALVREVAAEQAARTGPWIETTSYSTPIYSVPADQAPVAVQLDNDQPWARTLADALRAVPIPPDARPAAGTDAHLTIWQPSSDRLWELWRVHRAPDGWHAAWGGAMERVSESPGYFTPRSWPGARSYWGATASSLPVAAGTMTIAELRRGQIDHALAIDLPAARAGAYASPAQRTDGVATDPDAIPEGARLRIDPRLDVRGLYLPHMAEVMALAAQRYGMIVRDQTHHAIGFYGEDPTPTGTDPYPALMDHLDPRVLLAGFPWQHVQLLRMDLRQGTGRPR
jgi:hypothetical protein